MREPKKINRQRPKKSRTLAWRSSPFNRFRRFQRASTTASTSSLCRPRLTCVNKISRASSKSVKRPRLTCVVSSSDDDDDMSEEEKAGLHAGLRPARIENVHLIEESAEDDMDDEDHDGQQQLDSSVTRSSSDDRVTNNGQSLNLIDIQDDDCELDEFVSFNDGLDHVSHFSAPFEDSYYDEQLKENESTDQSDMDEDEAGRPFYVSNGINTADLSRTDANCDENEDDSKDVAESHLIELSGPQSESSVSDRHIETEEFYDCEMAVCQNPRFYHLRTNRTLLLILQHPSTIPLLGRVSVRTLWGHAKINGYVFKPDSNGFHSVCSFGPMGKLVLRTLDAQPETDVNSPDDVDVMRKRLRSYSSKTKVISDVLELFSTDKNKTVAVLFRKLQAPLFTYLRTTNRSLFEMPMTGTCDADSMAITKNYDFSLGRRLSNCIKWDCIRENILKDVINFGTSPRILVCGGSKVGKSTFCRHIVNSLLNECDKVSWFDTDPGQSEFTPPGLISVVEVKEPLLGPSFTHQKTPRQMCFVGGTSVADSPLHYMACVTKLFDYWSQESDLCQQPLIINTMGWRKGLGILFLSEIIRLMRPTHVVQIHSPTFSGRNMPEMTPKFVAKNDGLTSFGDAPPNTNDRQTTDLLNYAHYNIESLIDVQVSDILKTYFLHDLAMVAYFSQLHHMGTFVPLNECSCFSVPWSAVALHVCNQIVSKSEILNVFNGNLVALCECKHEQMTSSSDPTLPKFIDDLPIGECYGYGIVRAVSMKKKCLYVITPLASSLLRRVNALLVGSGIHLPVGLLKRQTVGSHLPYLTIHKRTVPFAITNRHIKPRQFKQRKTKKRKRTMLSKRFPF